MANILNGAEVQDMVLHWLKTPPNGYLGSGYGADLMALLQRPMAEGIGDAFIDKMIADIPVLGALPAGAVNIYYEDSGNDTKLLHIQVLDSLITVDNLGNIS